MIDIIYKRYEYGAKELKEIAVKAIKDNPGKDYWEIAEALLDVMKAYAIENGIPERFINEGILGYNLQSMWGTVKIVFIEMNPS